MPNRVVRILLVDDHDLVRSALEDLLNHNLMFQVVGSVATPQEALEKFQSVHCDMVLIDIELKNECGTELALPIRRGSPKTKIVFVSGNIRDQYVEYAINMKVDGFISKRDGAVQFVAGLRQIADGTRYFSDDVLERMATCSRTGKLLSPLHTRWSVLTPRQVEVLRYIASGFSKKEIAILLGIAVKTIDCHCDNVMRCLGVHDRVSLARYAVREGIVVP
ncbi:MAG: response regulator transcription factor [Planctomycetes bacterium]|nr:response regulator transcription factor [Planctomycetota bacterium]